MSSVGRWPILACAAAPPASGHADEAGLPSEYRERGIRV